MIIIEQQTMFPPEHSPCQKFLTQTPEKKIRVNKAKVQFLTDPNKRKDPTISLSLRGMIAKKLDAKFFL